MVSMHMAGSMIPQISCKRQKTADDTKRDMEDEGHGLYPLIGYFVILGRQAYGPTGVDACTI